jgi:hypothetical protein
MIVSLWLIELFVNRCEKRARALIREVVRRAGHEPAFPTTEASVLLRRPPFKTALAFVATSADHSTSTAARGQQVVEAFPEDTAPRYLLRDRDKIYGEDFQERVQGMGITEVKIAPQSPWQSPFAERLVGSVRRECLDHVIVLGEQHLRKILASYFDYYLRSRTHLSLSKDAPLSRGVHGPDAGEVVELPQVGGLHHRYERRVA